MTQTAARKHKNSDSRLTAHRKLSFSRTITLNINTVLKKVMRWRDKERARASERNRRRKKGPGAIEAFCLSSLIHSFIFSLWSLIGIPMPLLVYVRLSEEEEEEMLQATAKAPMETTITSHTRRRRTSRATITLNG